MAQEKVINEQNQAGDGSEKDVTIIKKYANRRLYNTATSSYVTLDFLCEMVKNGEEFEVVDAKTSEDITRSVLTQIIFEEESKGEDHMLPISFLRQLIGFYGNKMQSFVPSYLEMSMDAFSKNQDTIRQNMSEAFGANPAMKMFEESARQNMTMFQQGMKMFGLNATIPDGPPSSPWTQKPVGESPKDMELDALREEIAILKAELAKK